MRIPLTPGRRAHARPPLAPSSRSAALLLRRHRLVVAVLFVCATLPHVCVYSDAAAQGLTHSPTPAASIEQHAYTEAGGWSLADKLALGGLVVAALAIFFAMRQYADAKHQTRELEKAISQLDKHTEKLEDIWGSLSTHYLGLFPDYLPDIIETLRKAQKSIVIFCDYPAYGRFSSPDRWLQYKHLIERKIQRGVEVTLTCMEPGLREQYHRDQFRRIEGDWKGFVSKELHRNRLEQLYREHREEFDGTHAGPDALSFGDFAKLMEAANERMLKEVFGKAETQPVEIGDDMPLYFWLADGLHAVFAIPSLSDEATEYGFITGEAELITAFENMRERYLRRHYERIESSAG